MEIYTTEKLMPISRTRNSIGPIIILYFTLQVETFKGNKRSYHPKISCEMVKIVSKDLQFCVPPVITCIPYEIWGFHGDEDIHGCLADCDVVWSCIWEPTFRKNPLPP